MIFTDLTGTLLDTTFVERHHFESIPLHAVLKLMTNRLFLFTGTLLCTISPVDPALVQLVQQDLKFLQDYVDNLSVEFVQEKVKVRQELEKIAIIFQDWMKQMVERLNVFQGDHA